MAAIIGIHGIAHEYEGPDSLAHDWLKWLRDGLMVAGVSPLPEAHDFRGVFWGDLFRPTDTRAAFLPRLTYRDISTEWEEELLFRWWREAAAQDPMVTSPDDVDTRTVRAPNWLQRGLRNIDKSDWFRKFGGECAVLFFLKQVKGYLHDKQIYTQVQARVGAAISSQTRVLVAHSLGSVMAYEALCAHPEWKIATLVTLGSPLGTDLIFKSLRPPPEGDCGVWPNVAHWINITDNGDIVALEKDLSTRFGYRVKNVRVCNPMLDSHHVKYYLRARETGEAIATGWVQ